MALAAQGFGSKTVHQSRLNATPANRRALREVMNQLHLLQLDSVPVITRTQYLPVYSRRGHYPHDLHDQIAYDQDEWFEAWAHEASLLPVRFEPLLRWLKRRVRQGEVWQSLHRVATEEAPYVKKVLNEVRDRGPLRASELSDPRPHQATGGWGSGSLGSLALDWLFRAGELGVRRTGNFEKSFDVIDRIVPAQILSQETPTEDQALAELLALATQAHGVATAEDLIDYFRLPIKPARQALAGLLHAGRLEQCQVEGWKRPAYCLPGLQLPRAIHASALLSPFDPVVWCRDRAERLFDFEYRLEIYTPQAKRRWGYYVLPFLLGDRIVARVDLKNDRQAGVLRVLAAHLESGQDAGRVASALADELNLMKAFLSATRIVIGRRGNLIAPLRQAMR